MSRGRLDPEYRHHFYQATGWQEEVGLILPVRGGLTLMLFLGRLDKRSSLSRDELVRLEALFPLVHSRVASTGGKRPPPGLQPGQVRWH